MIQEILLFNDVPLFCIHTGDGYGKENVVVMNTTKFNFQKIYISSRTVCLCVLYVNSTHNKQ